MPENHSYRKLKKLLDFIRITKSIKVKEISIGAAGFGKVRRIMCLIGAVHGGFIRPGVEQFIAENNAAKWFCGFSLLEKTPDFTTICKFRNGMGTRQMGNLFHEVKRQMQAKNC